MARWLGTCDRVRRRSASNEEKWHAMMCAAEPVSVETFLAHVDLWPILDREEEPEYGPEQWVADQQRADPTAGAYRSWWGPDRAWFFQTAGFEYIFVED